MKLLKMRLKVVVSYILVLIMLSNSNFFSLMVDAAIPDNYLRALNVGDVLDGGKTYKIAELDDYVGNYDDVNFFFGSTEVDGIVEAAVTKDTSREHDFCYAKLNDVIYEGHMFNTVGSDGVEYYYFCKDYNWDNQYDYEESFLEYQLVGRWGSVSNGELGQDDEGYSIWGYDFGDGNGYDSASLPSDIKEFVYVPTFRADDLGYGAFFISVDAPSVTEDTFIGWQVTGIDTYYQRPEYYVGYTCDVTLIPLYSDTHVKVNYYTKSGDLSGSYSLWASEYVDKSSIVLKEGVSDLTDAVYVGWDKSATDIANSTEGEIDIYAQYGRITAITQQPVDASVYSDETARYTIEAVGENLQYSWYIGDEEADAETGLFMNAAEDDSYGYGGYGFIESNGYYESAGKSYGYSRIKSNPFVVTREGIVLKYDFFISCGANDSGYVNIMKKADDGSWREFDERYVAGCIMSDFETNTVVLGKGEYTVEFVYDRNYHTAEGDNCVRVKNIKLVEKLVSGDIFSTEEDPSIDASSPHFSNGKFVQCKVVGTYGTVYSDIVGLEVLERPKELLSISAGYNGDAIKVGENYDKGDVTVTARYKMSGEEFDEVVTTFEVDSTLVTAVGDNTFKATFEGKEANFKVPGGDVPGLVRELKAEDPTFDSANITWKEPSEKNGAEIEEYRVYMGDGAVATVSALSSLPDSLYGYNYEGLDDGASYTVEVSAVNRFGEGGKSSLTFTTDAIEVVKLEANYTGGSVFVGEKFDTDKVSVKVTYNNDVEEYISWDNLTGKPSEDERVVSEIGRDGNAYTVEYAGKSANFTVHGYYYDRIAAVYNGSSIPKGGNYEKSDVAVTLYYTDNTLNLTSKALSESEWEASSLEVANVGDNSFDAILVADNNFTSSYTVVGEDVVSSISAVYKGDDIYVGQNYDKDKVEVKLRYDSGAERVLASDEWDADSVTVSSVGNNTFTAAWGTLSATYDVIGYAEDKIEATYTGSAIEVGNEYSKDEVHVVLTYTNGTTRDLSSGDWVENSLLVEQEGVNTFTATYNTLTCNYVVSGFVTPPVTVSKIEADYVGSDVEIGNNYNKADVIVVVTYSDDTTRTLDQSEFSVDSQLVAAEGVNDFVATYSGLTDGFSVTGVNLVKSISAEYKGSSVIVGRDYNKSDVEVKARYSDNTERVLSVDEWTPNSLTVGVVGGNTFVATLNSDSTKKANYVVIGYEESVPVYETKLVAVYTGEDVLVGNEYDKNDVTVTVYFSDNSKRDLLPSEWTESGLVVEKVGDNTFVAKYNALECNYAVQGKMEAVGLEAKYTGSPIKVGSDYSKSDVEVTVKYHNDTTKTLSDTEWISSGIKVEKVGKNDYVATYGTLTAGYSVDGYREMVSITAKYNGKNILVGEDYAKADVEVKAVYHDGSEEVLDVSKWTESGLTVKVEGNNTFTATVGDLTADYFVEGYKKIVSIKAKYKGKEILVGKKYKKSDVEVKVVYHDKSEEILDTSEWKASSLKVKKKGKNTFTATVGDLSADYTVKGYKRKVILGDPPASIVVPQPQQNTPSTPTKEVVHTGVDNNGVLLSILGLVAGVSFWLAFRKKEEVEVTE